MRHILCCCWLLFAVLMPGHIARGHASGAFQHLASGGAANYRPNAARQQQQQQQGGGSSSAGAKQTLQPNQNNMQKLSSRICVRDDPLDGVDGHKLSAGVANTLKVSSAKAAAARVRAGDKSDRATVEQALDPRTRMVSCCCCCCCFDKQDVIMRRCAAGMFGRERQQQLQQHKQHCSVAAAVAGVMSLVACLSGWRHQLILASPSGE